MILNPENISHETSLRYGASACTAAPVPGRIVTKIKVTLIARCIKRKIIAVTAA
jgi:hypothetical protein